MKCKIKIITKNIFLKKGVISVYRKITNPTECHPTLVVIDLEPILNTKMLHDIIQKECSANNKLILIGSGNILSNFLDNFVLLRITDNLHIWQQKIDDEIRDITKVSSMRVLMKLQNTFLSHMEYRIAGLIKRDYDIPAISKILKLNIKTVYTHLDNMAFKLHMKGKNRLFLFIKNNL